VPQSYADLTPDEIGRAERFRMARPREQFLAARGTLRKLLASYLNTHPSAVPLTATPDGKPILADDTLHFNISHSEDLGLIAVADRRVGVDVEHVRPMPNAAGLVDRFFGEPERIAFHALPEADRLPGFFRGWTCKEALLKAVGVGLQAVDECIVDLDPHHPPAVLRFDHACSAGTSWHLAVCRPQPEYTAAVAVEATGPLLLDVTSPTLPL
jgi:4'-phosphopantetheinyl transferase